MIGHNSYLEALPFVYRDVTFDLSEWEALKRFTSYVPAHHLAWPKSVIVKHVLPVPPLQDRKSSKRWQALWTSYATHLHMVRKLEVHLETSGANMTAPLTRRPGCAPDTESNRMEDLAWLDAPISMPMPVKLLVHDPSVCWREIRVHLELGDVRSLARRQLVGRHGSTSFSEQEILERARRIARERGEAQWREAEFGPIL